MTALATAFVEIRPDAAGFGARLSQSVRADADRAGTDAGKRVTGRFKSALKVTSVLAGALAVTKGVTFFKDALAEADEARKVGAQTAAVLKSTGNQAGITSKQIGDLAAAISAKSGIDDEAIQSGANLLLTFKNVRNEAGRGNDVFSQATRVITDMSVALGQDMKSSSIQVGKALQDPVRGVTALGRAGVQFSDSQKATIKTMVATGDTMAAQKVILKELNSQFRGSAEAQATPAERARVAWGNLKETIGTELLPVVDRFATFLNDRAIPALVDTVGVVKRVSAFVADNRAAFTALAVTVGTVVAITKIYSAVLAVQAVGGLLAYAKATRIVTAVTKAYTAVQAALNLVLRLNPIGLVVTALAIMAVAVTTAYKKSETFRRIVDGAWKGIKTAFLVGVRVVVGSMLNFADKTLTLAAKAFGWVPGIGPKLREAAGKFTEFKRKVNAELSGIKDEPVTVSIRTIKFTAAQVARNPSLNKPRPAPGGGGGGALPRAMVMRAAAGGQGLNLRTKTNPGQVSRLATDIQSDTHAAALSQATRIQAQLKKQLASMQQARAASAGAALGAAGPGGRVLPRGSYRIGMPYLGYPGHYGADYPAPTGTPVYSPYAGRVVASYDLPGRNPYNSTPYRSYGRVVKIAHTNGLQTLYAHLSSRIGTGPVSAGSMIGRVGMNGNATGPHLHFESRRGGGAFNPASLGIFDRGGLARGRGLLEKRTQRPERVLSPKQTESFDRLVTLLERGAGGPMVQIGTIETRDDRAAALAIRREQQKALALMGV